MKKIQIILVATGVVVLSACSNYNNFSKRKFTKGTFRPTAGNFKTQKSYSERSEKEILAFVADPEKKANEPIHSREAHTEKVEETKFVANEIEQGILDHPNALRTSALPSKTERAEINQKILTSKVTNQSRSKKVAGKSEKRERKKSLTEEQKNARATLILGIVAMGIVISIFALVPILAFSGSFISIFALIRIPALLGMLGIFKGTAFYKEPLEGKYKKFRRKGLFLSVMAVALWLTLFLI